MSEKRLRILPPAVILPDQKLADFYQTARIKADGVCMVNGATMAALTQELLWHRQLNGGAMHALKVTLGAKELVEETELTEPGPAPLFDEDIA